jgi:hypothetical protein
MARVPTFLPLCKAGHQHVSFGGRRGAVVRSSASSPRGGAEDDAGTRVKLRSAGETQPRGMESVVGR